MLDDKHRILLPCTFSPKTYFYTLLSNEVLGWTVSAKFGARTKFAARFGPRAEHCCHIWSWDEILQSSFGPRTELCCQFWSQAVGHYFGEWDLALHGPQAPPKNWGNFWGAAGHPPLFEQSVWGRERASQTVHWTFLVENCRSLSIHVLMMTVWSYLTTVLLLTGMKFVFSVAVVVRFSVSSLW